MAIFPRQSINLSRMNKRAGFILPLVLIFLVILSSLAINQLENVSYDQQAVADEQAYMKSEADLKTIVKVISTSGELYNADCQIGHESISELKSKSPDWWHEFGCQSDTGQYKLWYVVERVIGDDCGAYYLRLTFNYERQHILIQANTLELTSKAQVCHAGLQNLYILN